MSDIRPRDVADRYIGLMSGTSVNSVDVALVEFSTDRPSPDILAAQDYPIPKSLRQELLALALPGPNEIDRVARLDGAVARLFAAATLKLLADIGLSSTTIRALGSHGQTVRHAPGADEPYTMQIGNPSLLAELTGITTVADFRRRDIAAGGQGAPLAPAFHAAFLPPLADSQAVVNIGGIANITLLPVAGHGGVRGFDTGPGNALLDIWASRHLGVDYDAGGVWGKSGRLLPELLQHCLADEYFSRPPPKSTGREWFHGEWLQTMLSALSAPPQAPDVQATLAILTATTIADALQSHAPQIRQLWVAGGGVHNELVMAHLRRQLQPCRVDSIALAGIDPDYLEATGFAWLARQTLLGQPGNVPAVTGARGPRVLGGIYPA